jgi:hypothetical protein
MESSSNIVIPTELVGTWGYYKDKIPYYFFKINADGSGYLFITSHNVKWSVSENRLGFRILNINCPESGSAGYSIIDGKLSFSEPLLGEIGNIIFGQMMPPHLLSGLDKIIDKFNLLKTETNLK